MGYRLTVFLLLVMVASALSQERKIDRWSFDQLQSYMENNTKVSKLRVINFWATWCAPCIKEMPYFEEVNTSYQNSVEVLLVSLDFADVVNTKVIPLLDKKAINTRVVVLTDENYNEWIGKVDDTWTGAIPATMFITKDGNRLFYEQEFEMEQLISVIEELKPKELKP